MALVQDVISVREYRGCIGKDSSHRLDVLPFRDARGHLPRELCLSVALYLGLISSISLSDIAQAATQRIDVAVSVNGFSRVAVALEALIIETQ